MLRFLRCGRVRPLVVFAALAALIAAAWWAGDVRWVPAGMTVPPHALLETATVIGAVLVCIAGWNCYSASTNRNLAVLGGAFIAVALLDLLHLLSYPGMPPFVTPASASKAIDFGIVGRLIAAGALLAVAILRWDRTWPRRRATAALAIGCAVAGVFGWIGLSDIGLVPITVVPGSGRTSFAVVTGYVVISLGLAAGLLFWYQARRPAAGPRPNAEMLTAAGLLLALAAACFNLHAASAGPLMLLGHAYKLISMWLVFGSIVTMNATLTYGAAAHALDDDRQRLTTTLASIADAVISTDAAGAVDFMNPEAERLTEWTRAAAMGWPVGDVLRLSPVTADPGWLTAEPAPDHPHGLLRRAMLRTRGGRDIAVEVRGAPIVDGADNLLGTVFVFHDAADREWNDDALIRAKQAAEHASEAKSRFLSAASHDLRQPLQTISILHGILCQKTEGTEAARYMEPLASAIETSRTLLNSLLDLNRLETGDITADLRPVAISELLHEVAADAAYSARARGLDLRTIPCGAIVRTDPTLLRTIIGNFVSNAVKYTDEGRILVGCRRRGGRLSVEVWDTGPGIPSHHFEEIFEEFHQLDNPERDPFKGVGLGLTICRRMAEILDHPVGLRSTVGKGSMFAVEVPLARPEEAQAASAGHAHANQI